MTNPCHLCGRDDGHHAADKCPLKKYGAAGEEVGAYLRTRIVHDCGSDCMIWTGAVSGNRKTPTARIPGDGPGVSVRRWVWESLNGPMPDRHRIVATCEVERCVSPQHMTPMNNSDVNRWIGKIGVLRTPEVRARRSAIAQRRSHLTREDVDRAREMRKAGKILRDIATTIGAHISTVHRICNGASWFDIQELTKMQDRPKYLRTLFAACPDGWTDQQIADAVGDSLEDAQAMLMAIWRDRKAARAPNPRGKGFVWRTALASDDEAGFLFDPEGEMIQATPDHKPVVTRSMAAFART